MSALIQATNNGKTVEERQCALSTLASEVDARPKNLSAFCGIIAAMDPSKQSEGIIIAAANALSKRKASLMQATTRRLRMR